ncbi:MAG: hypothetical protein COA79_03675 [Planctomycetota bacterium]|nr:MAG: hypothetical protein COA79_03675 [Planctomycetota bacterium]
MELSKINVENRERIKEVLGLNDGSLVKMYENDLLNELLETIEFFDDEEKNKFIPRIKDLNIEITTQQEKISKLEKELETAKSSSDTVVIAESKIDKKVEIQPAHISEEVEKLNDTLKKQISAFLKKKLTIIDNQGGESIHPKQQELEDEVLKLAKENSELNTIIVDDMDLIDSLMSNLKENNISWKHSKVDKRTSKLKHIAIGYQPLGRLFMYKKLLSMPQPKLVKEKE